MTQPEALADRTTSVGRPDSGVGQWRHAASAVVALLATPIGLVMIDIWSRRGMHTVAQGAHVIGGYAGVQYVVFGAGFLLVAGASGMLSGLGPLLAAIVWGLVPSAWLIGNTDSFVEMTDRLSVGSPSDHGVLAMQGLALFPTTAALLLAVAASGRWR